MTIDHVLDTLRNAWNTGDGAAWAAAFTADATFVDVLGRIQRGRAVIAAEHDNILSTIYRASRIDFAALAVRDLGAGLVLAHTESTLRVPAGPRAGTTHSVQTMLLHDGLITAFQNTVRLDDPAAFADHDADLAARTPQGWTRDDT